MSITPGKRAKLAYHVDAQLHSDFVEYVLSRHRKPGEVLEELMRRVIADGDGRAGLPAVPAVPTVPATPPDTQLAIVEKLEAVTEANRLITEMLHRMSQPGGPLAAPAATSLPDAKPANSSKLSKLRRWVAGKQN